MLTDRLDLKKELDRIFLKKGNEVRVEQSKNHAFPHVTIYLNESISYTLITTSSFPNKPPVVMRNDSYTFEQIEVEWSLNRPIQERLENLVEQFMLSISTKATPVYGIAGIPLTTNKVEAELANWSMTLSSTIPVNKKREIQAGLFSRTLGVLSKDIVAKRVLVIGVGSVGSYISEQLVRSGVGHLTIIDPDIVEYSNLSRTVYKLEDVNRPKVRALTRHLLNIHPSVQIKSFEKDILLLDSEELEQIVAESDVICAATDDPTAQRVINRFAYSLKKTAIFTGLYQGAEGGEVILSIPEKTPCYQCSTSIRHELERNTGRSIGVKTDYGTGKLEGVVAISADIHHVASAAVKILLSSLVSEESKVTLHGFVDDAIQKDFTYLTFSMKDQYWFYPHIFQEVPGQYAYQSVWLSPTRNENCPICGEMSHSTSLEKIVRTPSLASIKEAIE